MGIFYVDTVIHAPVGVVWDRLAEDIGSISEWNTGVKNSYVLEGAKSTGLGSQRYCDLGGNYLKEEVVRFAEERAITFRITDTDLPFARADIRFTMEPVEGTAASSGAATKVTCSPDYKLKHGCIGDLLDKCMVQRTYQKGMANLLAGLKKDVEAKH